MAGLLILELRQLQRPILQRIRQRGPARDGPCRRCEQRAIVAAKANNRAIAGRNGEDRKQPESHAIEGRRRDRCPDTVVCGAVAQRDQGRRFRARLQSRDQSPSVIRRADQEVDSTRSRVPAPRGCCHSRCRVQYGRRRCPACRSCSCRSSDPSRSAGNRWRCCR